MKKIIVFASALLMLPFASGSVFAESMCRSNCSTTTGKHMQYCKDTAESYCGQRSAVCKQTRKAQVSHCQLLVTVCNRAAKERCKNRCKGKASCSTRCNSGYASYCQNRFIRCKARAGAAYRLCHSKKYVACKKLAIQSCSARAGKTAKLCREQCRKG